MSTKHLSISQLGDAVTCKYKWYLKYKQRLQRTPGEVTPSALGDLVHQGLAAAFVSLYNIQNNKRQNKKSAAWKLEQMMASAEQVIGEWHVANMPEEKATIAYTDNGPELVKDDMFYILWYEMIDKSVALVRRTLEHVDAVNRVKVLGYDGKPMVEFEIEKDITEELGLPGDPVTFSGKVDLVYEDQANGNTIIVDWKVRDKMSGPESEELSSQLAVYQHILNTAYGFNIAMTVVYQIKNETVRQPSLNKNGSMSRQKIITDWPTYRQALLDNNLDPADYQEEMEQKLATIEFWRPLIAFRQLNITQKFWDNFLEQGRSILTATVYPKVYGYACKGCQFAEWCRAELYDDDTGGLIPDKYTIYNPKSEEDENDTEAEDE